MSDYRVNLEIYNGPLDLLLYLIRRDEVDIYDIPIARITQQYVEYVSMLQQLDPNLAGEFLVMAATLMEIKTRLLLPAPPMEQNIAGQDGDGLDPRSELVRQLLEYKAFKDAADDLRTAAAQQAQKFPRRPSVDLGNESDLDLEDVQVWDLLDSFSKIMSAIGHDRKQHEVIYDDTPVELHASDIVNRLQSEGPLTFRRIFEGRANKLEVVGLFLALLELVKQKKVSAMQDANFGEIVVRMNPDAPQSADSESETDINDSSLAAAGVSDSPTGGAADESAPHAEATIEIVSHDDTHKEIIIENSLSEQELTGKYVSDRRAESSFDAATEEMDEDDDRAEDTATGA